MLSFLLGLLGVALFFLSSMHSLVLLLSLESFVLFMFYFMLLGFTSPFTSLMFLLVGVCLGSYGVSLVVSNSSSVGYSFVFSFKY